MDQAPVVQDGRHPRGEERDPQGGQSEAGAGSSPDRDGLFAGRVHPGRGDPPVRGPGSGRRGGRLSVDPPGPSLGSDHRLRSGVSGRSGGRLAPPGLVEQEHPQADEGCPPHQVGPPPPGLIHQESRPHHKEDHGHPERRILQPADGVLGGAGDLGGGRDQPPQQAVRHDPDAPREREHHEGDPEEDGIDPEIVPQAGRHTRHHLAVHAPVEPPRFGGGLRRRRSPGGGRGGRPGGGRGGRPGGSRSPGGPLGLVRRFWLVGHGRMIRMGLNEP